MTAAQRPMTPKEWGLLLALSLLWGGSFFFVGVAVKQLPPLVIVATRVSIAAALLWALGPWLGLKPSRLVNQAGPLFLLGLVNNVAPFLLIVWAQTRLTSGVAAILNASTPVLTLVVAHAFTASEKLNTAKIAGALVGLLGVAVMIAPDFAGGSGDALAELASLGAATCYAFASVYARRFRATDLQPIDIATGQITSASLVLAPLALFFDFHSIAGGANLQVVAALLGLASLSTALAYIVYFRILAGAGAVNVVLVTLLAPATSVALGAIALGEPLPTRALFGLVFIAAGLGLIDGRAMPMLRRLARVDGKPLAPEARAGDL